MDGTRFGYLEGDDGVVLIQIDMLPGDPGDSPALQVSRDGRPRLRRAAGVVPLADGRPEIVARIAVRREVHVVELLGDRIARCYAARVETDPVGPGAAR